MKTHKSVLLLIFNEHCNQLNQLSRAKILSDLSAALPIYQVEPKNSLRYTGESYSHFLCWLPQHPCEFDHKLSNVHPQSSLEMYVERNADS